MSQQLKAMSTDYFIEGSPLKRFEKVPCEVALR